MKRRLLTHMQSLFVYFMFSFILSITASAKANKNFYEAPNASPVEGRWDLTIQLGERTGPAWLEITHSGSSTLVGQFVGTGGSARPISEVHFSNGKISFSIPPQWEKGSNLSFEANYNGNSLEGTVTFPDGKTHNCTGVRAPYLRRNNAPAWGKQISLFNGKDLKGWHASGTENQWKAENGILKSDRPGSNLITDPLFTDFKLHLEFRCPQNGNSGVYLRGRYEVQIADLPDTVPWKGGLGAVYGFITPSEVMVKKTGEWQSFDITIVGRMVSITANGKQIICNQEIPGITGGAIDSKEGEPGPLMLQGDHEPIEYRNIVVTPIKTN
jgi:hypothetical protein